MKYKCKAEGCNYETDNRHAIAGHIAGHIHRGELTKAEHPVPKRRYRRQQKPTPAEHPVPTQRQRRLLQQQTPTPIEIAAALLNAAVDAINKEQSLQEQVKVAKKRITILTEALTKTEEERDRVTRIHNEQVLAANKHGTDLPSTEALMEAAKLR